MSRWNFHEFFHNVFVNFWLPHFRGRLLYIHPVGRWLVDTFCQHSFYLHKSGPKTKHIFFSSKNKFKCPITKSQRQRQSTWKTYLILVIFFTLTHFELWKFYTRKVRKFTANGAHSSYFLVFSGTLSQNFYTHGVPGVPDKYRVCSKTQHELYF